MTDEFYNYLRHGPFYCQDCGFIEKCELHATTGQNISMSQCPILDEFMTRLINRIAKTVTKERKNQKNPPGRKD